MGWLLSLEQRRLRDLQVETRGRGRCYVLQATAQTPAGECKDLGFLAMCKLFVLLMLHKAFVVDTYDASNKVIQCSSLSPPEGPRHF